MKSLRVKDGSGEPPSRGRNGERCFKGEARSNATHASMTDADAKLYRKGRGQPAKLCFMRHALAENRHGLPVKGMLVRPAAQLSAQWQWRRSTPCTGLGTAADARGR